MPKLTDTGEKFGGARKDEIHNKSVPSNSNSQAEYYDLKYIWPKPNFKQHVLNGDITPETGAFYISLYKCLSRYPPNSDFVDLRAHQWPQYWKHGILWLKDTWDTKRTKFNRELLETTFNDFMRAQAKTKKEEDVIIYACGKHTQRKARTPFNFVGQTHALANYLWKLGWPYDKRITDKDGFCLQQLYRNNDRECKNPFWCVMQAKGQKIYYTDNRTKYPNKELGMQGLRKHTDQILKLRIPVKSKPSTPKQQHATRPKPDIISPRIGPKNPKRLSNAQPSDLMKQLSYRGVEFGNWVPQVERQKLINDTFDAAYDLCTIMGLNASFGSLWGRLGIAYGSRGRGGHSAHYNYEKKLIHINRYPGIGSYAHEMGHAIDYFIAEFYQLPSTQAASEIPLVKLQEFNPEFARLMHLILNESPQFKQNAIKNDAARSGKYWSSPAEMFARCFEAYIYDILKFNGRRNDFLVYGVENEYEEHSWSDLPSPYPSRLERNQITAAMHIFIKKSFRKIGKVEEDLHY